MQGLDLSRKAVRGDFFHTQHQFAQARSNDFITVFPQFVKEAASVGRVEFNVLAQVRNKVPSNDGKRVVRQLSQTVGPLVFVEVLDVAHRGAGSRQHPFVFRGEHVVKEREGVPGQSTEQAGEHIGHGSSNQRLLPLVESQGELMAEVAVAFDGLRKAERDFVGDFRHRVGSPS